VNRRIWPRIEKIPPRVYYLDLKRYHKVSNELSQTPFTPAVSNIFALDAALDELLKTGVANRIEHYRTVSSYLRSVLQQIGLELFPHVGVKSHAITTIKVPHYITFESLYEELKSRGYIVYACKEHLRDRYFQIANMGDLSQEMIQGFLDTLAHVLEQAAAKYQSSSRSEVYARALC
jgi:aspartate aminotransferase-like enzyme